MRYEKPLVIDMSLRARTASGGLESCYDGNSASGGAGWCVVGTLPSMPPYYQCTTGLTPGGGTPAMCISGGSAGSGGCVTGAAGTTVEDSCTSGPQPA